MSNSAELTLDEMLAWLRHELRHRSAYYCFRALVVGASVASETAADMIQVVKEGMGYTVHRSV